MNKSIYLLVVEDDDNICSEYEESCREYEDIFLVGTSKHASEALKLVEEFQPNAVVLDLELHKGSGSGLEFLTNLANISTAPKPFVVVVTNVISPATHSIARNMGADFIIPKSQKDYSVGMVLRMLHNIKAGLPSAKEENTHTAKQNSGQDYGKKLVDNITTELDIIGINPKHKGRNYLRDAIELISQQRRANICTHIGKKYAKTDASVERAMQTAINYAWRNTDIDTLEQHYTSRINPDKGVPTVTEFVYYYADKVKKYL